jgi:hypothetical protein
MWQKINVEALIRSLVPPPRQTTRRYHLPLIGVTSAKCAHCARRFVVTQPGSYQTKKPEDKPLLEQGTPGTITILPGEKEQAERTFETYCRWRCAKAHVDTVITPYRSSRKFTKMHCKYGHAFTPENTLISGKNRLCRLCHRRQSRKSYAAKHPQVQHNSQYRQKAS